MTGFRQLSLPSCVSAPAQVDVAAGLIGECARRALLAELMLTPKPGLVDRRNSGAHRDMDIGTFMSSARAISSWFPRFVEIGYHYAHVPATGFLSVVRPIGILCERAMFDSTCGVNTHKGAVFAFGLLCSAAGRLLAKRLEVTRAQICTEVSDICGNLVNELETKRNATTAGETLFKRYGLTGARGEAASGYSTVRFLALPIYDRLRFEGISEDVALLQVLLHFLAFQTDSNIVSRGGLSGLGYVHKYAQEILRDGGALNPDGMERIMQFDEDLIERNLSPGGSADLLAVTWFLARFPSNTTVS